MHPFRRGTGCIAHASSLGPRLSPGMTIFHCSSVHVCASLYVTVAPTSQWITDHAADRLEYHCWALRALSKVTKVTRDTIVRIIVPRLREILRGWGEAVLMPHLGNYERILQHCALQQIFLRYILTLSHPKFLQSVILFFEGRRICRQTREN